VFSLLSMRRYVDIVGSNSVSDVLVGVVRLVKRNYSVSSLMYGGVVLGLVSVGYVEYY